MKHSIVIITCLVVLLATGSAFADVTQGQDQLTDVDNQQWQLNMGVGNSTGGNQSITSNYEAPKMGLVNPYIPYHLHVGPSPEQITLWNALGFPYKMMEGKWSEKEAMRALKNTGKLGAEWGWGFTEVVTSFAKYPATKKINLRIQASFKELAEDYSRVCFVNVKADKGFTEALCLMDALKLAMKNGGDMVLLNPASSGMNIIMNGVSVGPGGSVGTATQNNSLAGSLGFNFSDTKAQGESAVILAVFKKNGKGAVGVGAEELVVPEKAPEAPVEIKPITPPKEETQEVGASLSKETGKFADLAQFAEQWLNS